MIMARPPVVIPVQRERQFIAAATIVLSAGRNQFLEFFRFGGREFGVIRTMKAIIKRRSAIEPALGYSKKDGQHIPANSESV